MNPSYTHISDGLHQKQCERTMDETIKRVVVTGMGAVTPLGQSVDQYWKNLVQGKSGIGPITLCDATPFPCRIAGEVSDFDPRQYLDAREARLEGAAVD